MTLSNEFKHKVWMPEQAKWYDWFNNQTHYVKQLGLHTLCHFFEVLDNPPHGVKLSPSLTRLNRDPAKPERFIIGKIKADPSEHWEAFHERLERIRWLTPAEGLLKVEVLAWGDWNEGIQSFVHLHNTIFWTHLGKDGSIEICFHGRVIEEKHEEKK